jgi:uncharacterized protein (TIGR03000 family)
MTSGSSYAGSQAYGSVSIRMRVPENAQVWFDDRPTTRQGTERDFISPPVSAGRYYTYHVRVQWTEGGKPVTEARDVTVRAGDRVNLSFGPIVVLLLQPLREHRLDRYIRTDIPRTPSVVRRRVQLAVQ